MARAYNFILFLLEDALPGLLLGGIVVLVGLDVTLRYVFNAPLRGVPEISLICIVWVVMLGSARAARTYQHILVEAFVENLEGRLRVAMQLVAILATIVIAAVVFIHAVPYAFKTSARVFSISGLSRAWITSAVPVGFGLMLLHYICDAVRIVSDLRNDATRHSDRITSIKNTEMELATGTELATVPSISKREAAR